MGYPEGKARLKQTKPTSHHKDEATEFQTGGRVLNEEGRSGGKKQTQPSTATRNKGAAQTQNKVSIDTDTLLSLLTHCFWNKGQGPFLIYHPLVLPHISDTNPQTFHPCTQRETATARHTHLGATHGGLGLAIGTRSRPL